MPFLSPSAAAPLMPFDVDLTPTPLADFLVGEDDSAAGAEMASISFSSARTFGAKCNSWKF